MYGNNFIKDSAPIPEKAALAWSEPTSVGGRWRGRVARSDPAAGLMAAVGVNPAPSIIEEPTERVAGFPPRWPETRVRDGACLIVKRQGDGGV